MRSLDLPLRHGEAGSMELPGLRNRHLFLINPRAIVVKRTDARSGPTAVESSVRARSSCDIIGRAVEEARATTFAPLRFAVTAGEPCSAVRRSSCPGGWDQCKAAIEMCPLTAIPPSGRWV